MITKKTVASMALVMLVALIAVPEVAAQIGRPTGDGIVNALLAWLRAF
jgi:hypothetical protein